MSEAQNMTVSMNHTLEGKDDFRIDIIQKLLRKLLTSEKPIGKRDNYLIEGSCSGEDKAFEYDHEYEVYYLKSDPRHGFYYGTDGQSVDVYWNRDRRRYMPKSASKGRCYNCGKVGHISRDCRSKRDRSRRGSSKGKGRGGGGGQVY